VHNSDRSVQYLSIRYTERLAEAGIATSVGSRGDSYDNALAESVIGLYKAELVHGRGPWRGCEDLELTTLEWVDWFNRHRLFSSIGCIPPAEYEAMRYPEPVPAGAGHSMIRASINPGAVHLCPRAVATRSTCGSTERSASPWHVASSRSSCWSRPGSTPTSPAPGPDAP